MSGILVVLISLAILCMSPCLRPAAYFLTYSSLFLLGWRWTAPIWSCCQSTCSSSLGLCPLHCAHSTPYSCRVFAERTIREQSHIGCRESVCCIAPLFSFVASFQCLSSHRKTMAVGWQLPRAILLWGTTRDCDGILTDRYAVNSAFNATSLRISSTLFPNGDWYYGAIDNRNLFGTHCSLSSCLFTFRHSALSGRDWHCST